MMIKIDLIQRNLLKWYQNKWMENKNKYPWRIGEKLPYEILIAEILLIHTTVQAVIRNNSYKVFLERFPDIYTLNKAKFTQLKEIFLPLGLYTQKSRRIKEMTKMVIEDYNGVIPNTPEDLKKIPMIGDYIRNALLTFAFNKNEVPLDNNLRRIAKTAFNIEKKKDVIDLWKNVAKIDPKKIYWSLFDVGNFHCRKPIPICDNCPFYQICLNKK